jgi:uncharacterized protein (TIGR02246 family)
LRTGTPAPFRIVLARLASPPIWGILKPAGYICVLPEAEGVFRMTDDERAIREVVDTWLAASKAGDLATVLSLMTDDVIFMVPGRKPFGKEAFAAASEGMKNLRVEGSSDIQEIRVLGDWAYLRNYIEMTLSPPAGAEPMRRSGYTLTILRREHDGCWRLARDANLLTAEQQPPSPG